MTTKLLKKKINKPGQGFKALITLFAGFLIAGSVAVYLVFQGYLWLNMPAFERYPVQGLDISAHQGNIDWPTVAKGPWSFVYIKSSEGGDFVDPQFASNWQASRETGILRGAYHFFTFCRSGREQAQNLIKIVPKESHVLPPVIDLEFGGNCSKRPAHQDIVREVQDFIKAMEAHYQQKPILYVTETFAKAYLAKGELKEYPLWYRNILFEPADIVGRKWLLWQFSNRGRVKGIKGFVDQNVFAGSPAEFHKLLK